MANKLGKQLGRKAVKVTLRHSVRGFGSKFKRQPVRSTTLLSIGGAVGATAGWIAGRKTAHTSS
jgi:hypothetical protein